MESKGKASKNALAYWEDVLPISPRLASAMVKWVEGDTVLANKDYTHFNFRGAHKVGRLLYTKLMSEYRDYNKKNSL